MVLEFLETGNQHLDNPENECVWKAPRYNFKTVFYKKREIEKRDGAAIKLNNNTIVVDFDENPEIGMQIYKLYPTFVVFTERGLHMYYKKPKDFKGRIRATNDTLTNCGALVDYKTGNRTMGTIKIDGKMRDYTEPFIKDLDELPELPVLLYPHKYSNSQDRKLTGLSDGDGRNSALVTHMWAVRERYKFNQQVVEDILNFINDFVLGDPLPKHEIKTLFNQIMNKESTDENMLEELNWRSNPEGTWKTLVQLLNIKVYNNVLYYEKDGRFYSDSNYLKREVNERVWLPNASMEEFMKQALVLGERVDGREFHIQFRNDYMLKNSPEVIPMNGGFTPYFIDVEYDEEAYDIWVDEFMDFVSNNDSSIRMILEEILGHMLMTEGFPHNVFFLTNASGDNGKSTFLNMVTNWLGDERTSNLSIQGFNDSTSVLSLEGKLANLGDDIDAVYMDESKNFKTLASGDIIETRKIYSEPVKFRNKATIVFTANKMPAFKDKTGGIKRRVKIIPFNNKITKVDRQMGRKLSSDNAKSYLLNLAIEGMERIINNGGKITESGTVTDETNNYFLKSDSAESFLAEFDISNNDGEEVFRMYEEYCDLEGFKQPVSKRTFIERASDKGFELTKKMGKLGGRSVILTEYVKKGDK